MLLGPDINLHGRVDLKWASTRENLSSLGLQTTEAQTSLRGRACASAQSDQLHCYWLIGKYHMQTCYEQNFNFLAVLCSWAGWFESHFVEKPLRQVLLWRGPNNIWVMEYTRFWHLWQWASSEGFFLSKLIYSVNSIIISFQLTKFPSCSFMRYSKGIAWLKFNVSNCGDMVKIPKRGHLQIA